MNRDMSDGNIIQTLFHPNDIYHGKRISLKKCHYTGHCIILKDSSKAIDTTIAIIDYLGKKNNSEDCLPFAMLVIGDENALLAEDNGEIGCGEILVSCLTNIPNLSVSCMICVTRYIEGAFVADMYQGQKRQYVKQAAQQAIARMMETEFSKKEVQSRLETNTSEYSIDPSQTTKITTNTMMMNTIMTMDSLSPRLSLGSGKTFYQSSIDYHLSSKVTTLTLDLNNIPNSTKNNLSNKHDNRGDISKPKSFK